MGTHREHPRVQQINANREGVGGVTAVFQDTPNVPGKFRSRTTPECCAVSGPQYVPGPGRAISFLAGSLGRLYPLKLFIGSCLSRFIVWRAAPRSHVGCVHCVRLFFLFWVTANREKSLGVQHIEVEVRATHARTYWFRFFRPAARRFSSLRACFLRASRSLISFSLRSSSAFASAAFCSSDLSACALPNLPMSFTRETGQRPRSVQRSSFQTSSTSSVPQLRARLPAPSPPKNCDHTACTGPKRPLAAPPVPTAGAAAAEGARAWPAHSPDNILGIWSVLKLGLSRSRGLNVWT